MKFGFDWPRGFGEALSKVWTPDDDNDGHRVIGIL